MATSESAAAVPDWLLAMRALEGTTEISGSGDSPKILAMRDRIAKKWASTPGMAAYCALYEHDANSMVWSHRRGLFHHREHSSGVGSDAD